MFRLKPQRNPLFTFPIPSDPLPSPHPLPCKIPPKPNRKKEKIKHPRLRPSGVVLSTILQDCYFLFRLCLLPFLPFLTYLPTYLLTHLLVCLLTYLLAYTHARIPAHFLACLLDSDDEAEAENPDGGDLPPMY